MHIAICDDNKEELSRICSIIETYHREKDSSITYENFYNATELLEAMTIKQFDLLFLDIYMPGISGMEAAWEIRQTNEHIPIIFLTSSREFAIESYRVCAADYIIKPAKTEEVFPALRKQIALIKEEEPYITLKVENGISKILLSQIVFVEVFNRKLRFTLLDGELLELRGFLSDYEDELLASYNFIKPHRSFIINICHVSELNKSGFLTNIGKTVPIARDSFSKTKTLYMKYLLKPQNGGLL